jgi:hypothetical protein
MEGVFKLVMGFAMKGTRFLSQPFQFPLVSVDNQSRFTYYQLGPCCASTPQFVSFCDDCTSCTVMSIQMQQKSFHLLAYQSAWTPVRIKLRSQQPILEPKANSATILLEQSTAIPYFTTSNSDFPLHSFSPRVRPTTANHWPSTHISQPPPSPKPPQAPVEVSASQPDRRLRGPEAPKGSCRFASPSRKCVSSASTPSASYPSSLVPFRPSAPSPEGVTAVRSVLEWCKAQSSSISTSGVLLLMGTESTGSALDRKAGRPSTIPPL